MDSPVRMSWVSPGFRVRGSSRQARRSNPADPSVAYSGKAIWLPIRSSRMRTCKFFLLMLLLLQMFANQHYEARCNRFLGVWPYRLLPIRPEHRDGVIVAIEAQAGNRDIIGDNHVPFFALHFLHGLARHVFGFSCKANSNG